MLSRKIRLNTKGDSFNSRPVSVGFLNQQTHFSKNKTVNVECCSTSEFQTLLSKVTVNKEFKLDKHTLAAQKPQAVAIIASSALPYKLVGPISADDIEQTHGGPAKASESGSTTRDAAK